MQVVRRKAAGVVLAGLAAAGVAVGAPSTQSSSVHMSAVTGSSCKVATNTIGHVTVIARPKLWHNGKPRRNKSGFGLRRKDYLRTAQRGTVDFCLAEGETSCRGFPGVKLRIRPNDKFVVNFIRGQAQCSTSGGTKDYVAGDTVIEGDPVFSVAVTKTATVVKVFLGAVKVFGDSGNANEVVAIAGSQTSARRGEGAVKPSPMSLTKRERRIFKKLAQALPQTGLAKPNSEGSKALQTIFDRGALLVEVEPNANLDSGVRAFTQDFLGYLAKSWGVALKSRVSDVKDAAPRLAGGRADLFVTAAPNEVTETGIRQGLGGKAGAAGVPFVGPVGSSSISRRPLTQASHGRSAAS